MGLLDRFRAAPPRADTYAQSDSTVLNADGRYDMTKFTAEEHNTILAVLQRTDEKYPAQYRAVGLAIEARPIMYKAKYVLNDIIVLRHESSAAPLDQLAVGLAYSTKGAYYRPQAIRYLSTALPNIGNKDIHLLSAEFPLWSIYDRLADLCESEAHLEDALRYSKMAERHRPWKAPIDFLRPGEIYRKLDIERCVKYYRLLLLSPAALPYQDLIREKLKRAESLAAKGYVYKPRKRKRSDADTLFDKHTEAAARYFCKMYSMR